ncbi:unnamed protein product [Lupinus luteus]|uniref:Myb-like domain-containing protein n=1 Tax=Lupinus luteus TaxID=3873 RepID=A0AAV1XYQ6_LUPLU
MEMEDNHHHYESQYSISDLRQIVNGPTTTTTTLFSSIPLPPPPPPTTAELFRGHPNLTATTQHYEMMMFGRQVAQIIPPCSLHNFVSTNSTAAATTTTTTNSASAPPRSGLEAETTSCIGGDGSTGRWPRQETLSLLHIRSCLDPKFKETNQKGPLWDEVSRIMSEEHGYQRSGKKCREKFENLYKYYKKTKEGKGGRQDRKHYRFFRQLEALYGENSNQTSVPDTNFCSSNGPFPTTSHAPSHKRNCDSLSLTNSTDFDISSSDDNDHSNEKLNDNDSMNKRRGRRWKVKIKEFFESQMMKLVEKQEEWMAKLMKRMEQKENERVLREEEWRRQESERLEREHKFWAKERAWIEARDIAVMEALHKLTGTEIEAQTQLSLEVANVISAGGSEVLNIIKNNYSRSNNAKEANKKRKKNSITCFYFDNSDHQSYCNINDQRKDSARMLQTNEGSSPLNSNVGSVIHS